MPASDVGSATWQVAEGWAVTAGRVQCGQMVGSTVLDGMKMGSVMCQQIWDPFWLSQLATVILVQCGQMVGSSVLDGI